MDDLLEALQFAEARLEELGEHELVGKCAAALTRYKAEQEPVAWMSPNKERLEFSRKDTVYGSHTIPLYATPVRTKDLTDDEIDEIGKSYFDEWSFGFARAVIAADREKNK